MIPPLTLPWWWLDRKAEATVKGLAPLDVRWAWRDEEQDQLNAARAKSWALRFKLQGGK